MSKVYIIEIDESDSYDVRTRILTSSFKSYDSAKNFLLKDFDVHKSYDCSEWFSLKENGHYTTDYDYDAVATIMELDLYD